jgi:hypothetical protein
MGHNPEDLPFSAGPRPRIRQHFARHWGAWSVFYGPVHDTHQDIRPLAVTY